MALQVQAKSQQNSIIIKIAFPDASIYQNLSYNFQMLVTIYSQEIPTLNLKKVYQKKFVVIKNNLKIESFEFSKTYKINIKARGGGKQWLQKNVYVSTPSRKIEFEQNELDSQQLQQNFPEQKYKSGIRQFANNPAFESDIQNDNTNQVSKYYRPLSSEKSSLSKTKHGMTSSISNTKDFCNSQLMMKMIGETTSLVNKKQLRKYILEGRKCRNIEQFINQKQKITNNRKVLEKKVLLAQGISVFSDIYKNSQGMTFFKNDWFMGPFYSYDGNQDKLKKF